MGKQTRKGEILAEGLENAEYVHERGTWGLWFEALWSPSFRDAFSFPSLVPLTVQNPLIPAAIAVIHGWDHESTSPDLPASSVFQGKSGV